MDNKDGRRNRVPAGTFGGSEPPESEQAIQSEESTQPGGEEPTRPGLRRVSAQPPPVPQHAASDALDQESESERRKRYVSTLVGHPSGGSAPGAKPGANPNPTQMLAPPKWTGAGAYLEGQEPQPRVSALPAPQHVPMLPATDAEPSRNRITTKVGHVHVQPLPIAAESAPRPPPIGDAIQEMLDSQTAVSMQVEEPRDAAGDEEMPIDELQIEEILDGLSEAPPPPAPDSRFQSSRGDEPTLQHVAPPPADAPTTARGEPVAASALAREADGDTLRPPAQTARAAEAPAAAPPVRAAVPAPPQPAAPRPAVTHPKAPPPPEVPRPRRAAVEVGLRADAAASVSSLAPAEVARRPRYRDDSQAGLGVLLLAAMAVIGVGGWFLTRGSYRGPRPAPAQASAPADPAPAPKTEPAKDATNSSAKTGAATATAADGLAARSAADKTTEPTESARRSTQDAAKRADAKPRTLAKAEDSPHGVVKITPKLEPAELPDIPSRDNVVAALGPLRSAVVECAHGQRGVAQLDITVANNGAVTHAIVGGDFAGTAEGSCIARAARSAAFVPFKKPRFRVIYPFSL